MPELPEVETIRRSLTALVGAQVRTVRMTKQIPLCGISARTLRSRLINAKCTAITRRGKYLLLCLSTDQALLLHLGMSGRLDLLPSNQRESPRPKHCHLELIFSDGQRLRYVDPRRFGKVSWWKRGEPQKLLDRLGMEYDDERMTSQLFIAACRGHPGITIKSLLLRQDVIPGIGNIYACEILYEARIDPRSKVGELSDEQLRRLLTAIRVLLKRGIRYGGTTLRDYRTGDGTMGKMQHYLQVYGRDGRTRDGKQQVSKIVQQGRSTWFAPKVQVS